MGSAAMFGRVRASSCPAESLDRPPPKIFKDDSLSIYEATLMKLKLGSQRNPTPCSENEVTDMDLMSIEFECASSSSSSHQEQAVTTSSSDCISVGTVMQPRNKEVSVLYLFSKFKRAHDLSSEEAMTVDSVGVSLSSSGSGSVNNTQQ